VPRVTTSPLVDISGPAKSNHLSVDISGLLKPDVLLVLCRRASPRRRRQTVFPWLLPARRWMTCTDMHAKIDSRKSGKSTNLRFEEETWVIDGVRVQFALFVNLAWDEFDPRGFDYHHGDGAAQDAIRLLRKCVKDANKLMKLRWESKI
jgi:hypothetical protein